MASSCDLTSFDGPERMRAGAMFPCTSPLPHQAADRSCQRVIDGSAPVVPDRRGDDAAGPVRLEPNLTALLHSCVQATCVRELNLSARKQPHQSARRELRAPHNQLT